MRVGLYFVLIRCNSIRNPQTSQTIQSQSACVNLHIACKVLCVELYFNSTNHETSIMISNVQIFKTLDTDEELRTRWLHFVSNLNDSELNDFISVDISGSCIVKKHTADD